MKTKEQILKIEQIKIEPKFYPRVHYSATAVLTYSEAMENGNIFPPIQVAKIAGAYYLIDGKHRIESNKHIGNEHIKAIVREDLAFDQLYLEAVKSNLDHGVPFETGDRNKIIKDLTKLKLEPKFIANLMGIDVNQVELTGAKEMKKDVETISKGDARGRPALPVHKKGEQEIEIESILEKGIREEDVRLEETYRIVKFQKYLKELKWSGMSQNIKDSLIKIKEDIDYLLEVDVE